MPSPCTPHITEIYFDGSVKIEWTYNGSTKDEGIRFQLRDEEKLLHEGISEKYCFVTNLEEDRSYQFQVRG